jgi:hypothetical protein
MGKVLSNRWLRAAGAALTLAGAAIVFVVLFLPTGASARATYCNLEAGGSHRAASIKGFQRVDKGADTAGDLDGSNEKFIAIYMSDASHINFVWFPAGKGDGTFVSDIGKTVPWIQGSSVFVDSGTNTVYAEVADDAVKGKIRVNNSSDPTFCYVQTSKTFNPA